MSKRPVWAFLAFSRSIFSFIKPWTSRRSREIRFSIAVSRAPLAPAYEVPGGTQVCKREAAQSKDILQRETPGKAPHAPGEHSLAPPLPL
jgi:hypothetical protein